MKLSKTGLILLLLGILVIVLANLSAAQSQQVSGKRQLMDDLVLAKQRLSSMQFEPLNTQQADLQKQLDEALANLEKSEVKLSKPLNSTDASDSLFSIASACNVQVASITSSGIALQDLEGIDTLRLPLSVTVKGDAAGLMLFIVRLNESLSTGAIESVQMTISASESSAVIQVNIYSYRGEQQ